MKSIKVLRQELGISQRMLAQRIGVAPQTVWRWEHGLGKPSPMAQEKLKRLNWDPRFDYDPPEEPETSDSTDVLTDA